MGKLNLVERSKRSVDNSFAPVAIIAVSLLVGGSGLVASFLMYGQGQKDAERTAREATGFVGCNDGRGGAIMKDFGQCAALKAFLARHSEQGTYVVYTDKMTAPPPAPTR